MLNYVILCYIIYYTQKWLDLFEINRNKIIKNYDHN
nr:MAG TPA: hypothetical protein [Caudoviricetes sp.]